MPQGYFSLGEDGALLEQAEGYTPGEEGDMSVASWCHRVPGLGQHGCCEAWTPEASKEDEGDALTQDPEVPSVVEGAEELLSGAGADTEFDHGLEIPREQPNFGREVPDGRNPQQPLAWHSCYGHW